MWLLLGFSIAERRCDCNQKIKAEERPGEVKIAWCSQPPLFWMVWAKSWAIAQAGVFPVGA